MNFRWTKIIFYLFTTPLLAEVAAFSVSDRRTWLVHTVATATTATVLDPAWALADSSKLVPYEDSKHGFCLQVPKDWVATTRTLPDRRTIRFWTDPTDAQTFLFVAYTPVRDDFTSLGSFGSVDVVAEQTILPKGQLAGVDIQAKMLAATAEKQAYFFDYQQSVPDVQPMTHFRTIFTLQQGATGGAGAVLVTITAQTPESRYEGLRPLLDDVVASFDKIKVA